MIEIKTPKKLIEVALPLDAINKAAAREKLPGIGPHPRGIHQWWARRPLTAARAVIFAQMVNDPGYERYLGRGLNKERAAIERERLFSILERLVQWDNTNNEEVIREAREEILKSWRETCLLNKNHPQAAELFDHEKLPAFHDPFAGGGALPYEAQRMGLEAWASDLNPVAVIINKTMIEIPYKFVGQKPIGPIPDGNSQSSFMEDWSDLQGLAEDVRRYANWMQREAEKHIGHLYPKIEITEKMTQERPDLRPLVGTKLTVISWLWVRTVKSPNPAFSHVDVPLASSFVLSYKSGKETYVEPLIVGDSYSFVVKKGRLAEKEKNGTKMARGANFRCVLSDTPIEPKYIKSEGVAGRLGKRLMAIVAVGKRERVYLSPTEEHECIANQAIPSWKPETSLPDDPRNFWTLSYGLTKFSDLFTERQLVTLTIFSNLVQEVVKKAKLDAIKQGMKDNKIGLDAGGDGATAYAEAIGVYVTLVISRLADFNNTLCGWNPSNQKVMHLFTRQAVPMVWDYGEANMLANVVGGWPSSYEWLAECIEALRISAQGYSIQMDAANQQISRGKIISTDPPYYDNIGYADLSDFFYVWLRRSLKGIFPHVFATLAVPKEGELVATPYRHGSKEGAEKFFLSGMTSALHNLVKQTHPAFPVTIYYAFKQSETKSEEGTSSTGWETFLEAILCAGFAITGTWPMRSEQATRMIGMGSNALASSIVLVCRKRDMSASTITRREFIRELNAVLPEALDEMTRGGVNSPVAPVDLSQAIIGPGMAIFSQYAAVLEADGRPMSVRTALQLINRFLAEDDFDHDTQFCLSWFENSGWSEWQYGDAEVLSKSKGTSVDSLQHAGVADSGQGKFRLLRWGELSGDWSPSQDQRTPVWEGLHRLIRALNQEGEAAAGQLLAGMPTLIESVRSLAYRLYTLCERKGWAEDARAYNELINAWQGIEQNSYTVGHVGAQTELEI
jgi:putative DNA methylase